MNPLLDQVLVWTIVASAAGWFVWRWRRRRASGKDCDSGCCGGSRKPLG